MKQDLVDYARPGDRIVLTGVVRIEQERISGVTKSESALYRLRMDGNNIEFIGGKGTKSSRRTEREEISPDEEKIIRALSKNPDIYNRLIASFAPHIRGHEIFKEAILLLIVGSTQRALSDGSKVRGDINVFLVGDPGTAKSEMLKFCSRIAPRGLYTSGRGSTAAGLTAAVVRDTSGIFMLEAGAVVLGDQGLVCIDEFDKMRPEDRSALHEVMEQQSASIAKGGIVATLNARTSILAAANPMFGKYDPFKNLTENVNLPIPLLTRFDLVFVVRDIPTPDKDRQIAEHIINQHGESGTDVTSLVDIDILTKYLGYAKRIDPILTKEAETKIVEFYLKMRSIEGDDKEKMITITPRQLEGLIRLSTARARLLLKNQVEGEDADRAIFLFNEMLNNSGIDVNTGKVDIGVLQGRPRSEVSKLATFMETIRSLEGDNKSPVLEQELIDELEKSEKFKDEDEVRRFIRKMINEASIYESTPGHYNTV
jgi:replicative DNA helicase Mcm